MSATTQDPGFGGAQQGGDMGVKNRMVMLINSVRTLMRSTFSYFLDHSFYLHAAPATGKY